MIIQRGLINLGALTILKQALKLLYEKKLIPRLLDLHACIDRALRIPAFG
jgi:hypothetical protein